MKLNCLHRILIVSCIAVFGPSVGLTAESSQAQETEILKITVGEPTFLTPVRYQNSSSVAVSRTGTVAAFYMKPGTGPKFYRISKDAGRTWGPEMDYPPGNVGRMSVGLRDGGVLFMIGQAAPADESDPPKLQATRVVFSDDFLKYKASTSAVSMPQAALNVRWAKFWPPFDKGKIVQLPDGSLLATLYGNFKGDAQYRTMICRSTDNGLTWQLHASVAYSPKDPHPYLAGSYCGYCEPSLALLADGQLLCIMRTQGAQYAGEYRPLYQSWSKDMGKTWTRPILSKPYLMNISPTLAVLDNGVVVAQYGRPGGHVAFSLDNGHTWQDRIRFSDLPEPVITGQFDMVRVGPNRLVVIGSDAAGTKVWPIAVQRVKVAQTHVPLQGRVLDEQGKPIADATVELGPNRYYLDAWLEHETALDPWKATPMTVGSPVLGYQSIRKENGYPTVQTDAQGRFRFESVKIADYVLTVEADGYAPQCSNIEVRPPAKPQEFRLKPGRKIRGRIVDNTGRPVSAVCVVLNRWHVHTDRAGFFHWSVQAPLPKQVEVNAYRRYSGQYGSFKGTLSLSDLERRPITLRR